MEDTLRRLFELKVDTFVEIGPGKALSGFVKKTAKALDIKDYRIFNIENADDIDTLKEGL